MKRQGGRGISRSTATTLIFKNVKHPEVRR